MRRINRTSTFALCVLHSGAALVFVPWLFDWRSVIFAAIAVPLFGLGINMGYHRLLAHRSFQAPRWFEYCLVFIALCCLQDTPIKWISNHRLHHAKTDKDGDPHSPVVSLLWSHCGWLFFTNKDIDHFDHYEKYVPDLLQDRWYLQMEKGYTREIVYVGHAFLIFCFGMGYAWCSSESLSVSFQLGSSFLVWTVFLRTVVVWHITWSVNSVAHRYGYRNYETADQSRNNFFIGIISGGEGWHNNHHANPSRASTRRSWWEFDLIYLVIIFFEKLGIISAIKK